MPPSAVTAVIQTADGYPWVGTYGGLARFDGVRFTVFDTGTAGLATSRITSLLAATNGVPWIGHEGGEMSRLEQGRFAPVALGTHRHGGKVLGIASDEIGDIWLLSEVGVLLRVRDSLV